MTYDKRQNLRAMLEGKPHEHIPVSFFQHIPAGHTEGMECVKEQLRVYEQTDFDFIKIMHDGLTAPLDLNADSMDRLREYRPLLAESPYVKAYTERAYLINKALHGKVDTYCNVFSPMTLLRRIGSEKWKCFYRENPSAVRDVLLYMAQDLAYLCKRLLTEAGCIGIFYALQGAETGYLEPEEYIADIRESDMLVLEAAQEYSSYNILHFCGWNGIPNQLELWRDYPGNTVNWDTHVEEMSLAEGRNYFGMRNCLGGFDNRRDGILYTGSREMVEQETVRILEAYANSYGNTDNLMIGGDCSYLPDFETERFNWVTETVRKWECKRKNG